VEGVVTGDERLPGASGPGGDDRQARPVAEGGSEPATDAAPTDPATLGAADVALTATGLAVDRGRRRVLDGVDLELRRGEVTVLLGPNGAGKSTLLAAISGGAPLAAGRVEADGRIAAAAQTAAFAGRGVRANVELALSWWGVPREERRPRAAAALDSLGVAHLADRAARTLSGGEARRVHLARVLAVRPDVLLLDEPFAGLDPSARDDVLHDLAALLRTDALAPATCVVVHDRAEAWALADRVVVLIDGRVAASGPPAEVLDHPPTPKAARFLGFTGELRDGDTLLLTRQGQVTLDPSGPYAGTITRRLPTEDGTRLDITLPTGRLQCLAPRDAPAVGTEVHLRLTAPLRFPT
jgi:ABC-type multidrug transport system ATPase subunit